MTVDDVRYTVGPMERGIARINRTLHQISENMRQIENQRRRKSKDDSYFIPMNSWSKEFSEVHDHLSEGSFNDSGLTRKRRRVNSKFAPPHIRQSDASPECGLYGFGGSRCSQQILSLTNELTSWLSAKFDNGKD
uniref:Uncharacterized protein n=1 Tax=Ananas comosus var. bracteatus TaxID=296719 RepID=A0A6V7QC75_ANACO|nr:unnamed protein product [Ananas comosus var. bracteatus]